MGGLKMKKGNINPNCPKCKGGGFFLKLNNLTGNIIKIPCLCIPQGLEQHPFFRKEIKKSKTYMLCPKTIL